MVYLRLTCWLLGLIVVSCCDLLHQPLEVGPVERHGAVDEGVQQHTQGPQHRLIGLTLPHAYKDQKEISVPSLAAQAWP